MNFQDIFLYHFTFKRYPTKKYAEDGWFILNTWIKYLANGDSRVGEILVINWEIMREIVNILLTWKILFINWEITRQSSKHISNMNYGVVQCIYTLFSLKDKKVYICRFLILI